MWEKVQNVTVGADVHVRRRSICLPCSREVKRVTGDRSRQEGEAALTTILLFVPVPSAVWVVVLASDLARYLCAIMLYTQVGLCSFRQF